MYLIELPLNVCDDLDIVNALPPEMIMDKYIWIFPVLFIVMRTALKMSVSSILGALFGIVGIVSNLILAHK